MTGDDLKTALNHLRVEWTRRGDEFEVHGDMPSDADLEAALAAAKLVPVEPTAEDRLASLEAEVRGMKDRAAAEAAKATPTARGVAAAIAQDGR